MWRDLHVCGTRVRVTTRYSEKFKINISSPPYRSNETFYTKALEYKEYFTPVDLQYSEEFRKYSIFSPYEVQNVWPSGE